MFLYFVRSFFSLPLKKQTTILKKSFYFFKYNPSARISQDKISFSRVFFSKKIYFYIYLITFNFINDHKFEIKHKYFFFIFYLL